MEERKRLGERLVEAGFITEQNLAYALDFQKKHGGRLGEVLLENGLIAEQSLLRFLAAEYRTRYVSTEKLAKVRIPSAILDRIPVQMAETACVLPILWDETKGILSVVMAEPQNLQLIEEVRLVAEGLEVAAYISSKSAVLAGVRKHYYGDITAFAHFEANKHRAREDVRGLVEYYEHAHPPTSELRISPETGSNRTDTIARFGRTSVRKAIEEVRGASLTSDNDFIETLNVLVGLLELPRQGFKGHSAAVAKLTRSLSRRMGLSERDTNHNIIAAYLHDLGKKSSRHITALKIADDPTYRNDALRYHNAPSRLFEAVHLPVEVNSILTRLYEAWDGTGVPDGVKANDIPLGSRIIAAVDALEDLSRGERGSQVATDKDSFLRSLEEYSGTVLDPAIVELMAHLVTGDLMRQTLLAEGQHVMLVEPDPENASLLDLKLTQKGHVVSIARDAEAAVKLARDGVDIVISETALPGEDGFALLATLRQMPACKEIPFIFLTTDPSSQSVERGLAMGAADYVVKPFAVEVLLAKIKRYLGAGPSGSSRAVRGSLDEMGLDQIVEVLASGGRSGQLVVTSRHKLGDVFFESGRVVHASFGRLVGPPAFSAVLEIRSGDFVFDPSVFSSERTVSLELAELLKLAQTQAR